MKYSIVAATMLAAVSTAAAEQQEYTQSIYENVEKYQGLCAGIMPIDDVLYQLEVEVSEARAAGLLDRSLPNAGDVFKSITYRYIALADLDFNNVPDDRLESLGRGHLLFRNFRPVEARFFFEPLLDGDDFAARAAWRNMTRMYFAVDDDIEKTTEAVEEFARKFEPTILDIADRSSGIRDLATHYMAEQDIETVIDLTLAEFERLPGDAPYTAYRMPIIASDTIQNSPRFSEVKSAAAEELQQIKKARQNFAKEEPPASKDPIVAGIRPGYIWIFEGARDGETFYQARLRQFDTLISDLESWLND